MPLQLKVNQWGNTLGVRLPKSLRDSMNLQKGDDLEFTEHKNGEWTVKPIRQNYTLETLLSEHGETQHETLWDNTTTGEELL